MTDNQRQTIKPRFSGNSPYLVYEFDASTEPGQPGEPSVIDAPEQLASRDLVRLTLVDPNKPVVRGQGGVIVEVPAANVVATTPHFADQPNGDPMLSAEELLAATPAGEVSSVFVRGGTPHGKVEVVGYYFAATLEHGATDSRLAGAVRRAAKQRDLAVHQVMQPPKYQHNRCERIGNGLVVDFDNKRHVFPDYDPRSLADPSAALPGYLVDDGVDRRWMGFVDCREALNFAVDAGAISRDESAQMRKLYDHADRFRTLPDIEFDERGEIVSVTRVAGDDLGEQREVLSAPALPGSGASSHIVNLYEQRRQHRISEASGRPVKTDKFTRPLPDDHARALVELARRALPEHAHVVASFAQRVEVDLEHRRRVRAVSERFAKAHEARARARREMTVRESRMRAFGNAGNAGAGRDAVAAPTPEAPATPSTPTRPERATPAIRPERQPSHLMSERRASTGRGLAGPQL